MGDFAELERRVGLTKDGPAAVPLDELDRRRAVDQIQGLDAGFGGKTQNGQKKEHYTSRRHIRFIAVRTDFARHLAS